MSEEERRRISPQSELDLALMTTDAVWGKPEVSPELKTILNKYYRTKDEKGQVGYTTQSLWGLLSYYTRDLRLSNLNKEQMDYVKHFYDLAGDCLQEGLIRPFIICLSRSATILELSQSKGGFLRKNLRTKSEEFTKTEIEPPKRRIFGGGKNKGGNYE